MTLILMSTLLLCTFCKWSIEQVQAEVEKGLNGIDFRSPQSTHKYVQFRDHLKQTNITVSQYIQNQKFGYDGDSSSPIYHLLNITHNEQSYPAYLFQDHLKSDWISIVIDEQDRISGLSREMQFLLLTENDFPYDMEEGVEHWLVWSNREVDLSLVHALMNKITSQEYEYYAFINPAHMKSVPEIFHAQIFIQKIKAELQL